jgi:hypothetical protein
MCRRNERPEIGIGRSGRANLQVLHARDELVEQDVAGFGPHGHRHRYGHAAFTGRAVAGANEGIDGLIHVGVGHHDHVVLGAAEALHALAGGTPAAIDVFRNWR